MKYVLYGLVGMLLLSSCSAANRFATETGKVKWGRDHELALKRSKETGKPVFLLFQEVPGCAGCKQFGREVLSDPQIVEAIESEFVPLMIPNNQPGKDADILKQYGEPAWNYQVVRFLDSNGKDLIPRKDRIWTRGPLAKRMIEALRKAKRPAPAYLELLVAGDSSALEQAAFSMFCFWTGEAKLGAMEGVVTTEAGWIGGHEVTLVAYDPSVLPLDRLIQQAKSVDCARAVYLPKAKLEGVANGRIELHELKDYRKAKASDQKRQLQGTKLAHLSMTPAQATKVNAWIRTKPETALGYLSPAQLEQIR